MAEQLENVTEALADRSIGALETSLDSIGLMRGDYAPSKRFVLGAIIGGLITTQLRPNLMFTPEGPRAWSVMSPNDPEATLVPWWVPSILLGTLLGIFI